MKDKKGAGDAADRLAEGFFGVGADEVSALFMIDLIRSAKTLENMSFISHNGGQFMRIRQGWSRVPA